MNKLLLALVAGCALTMTFGSPAFSNDIVGTVMDANGNPLQGLQIIVKAQNGQTMAGSAITNPQGQYQIGGLNSGLYNITLDPKGTNLTGQTVVSNLNGNGLTVNWAAAPGRQAIATAQPGIQQPSASSVNSVGFSSEREREHEHRCDGDHDEDDKGCRKKSEKH
jgi:hypothetical protein